MTATGTPDERKGCGAEATRIVFRGRTRRLYLCDDCPYKGDGAVHRYNRADDSTDAGVPVFAGERRKCGDETS